MPARTLNLMAAVWLFFSAFPWARTSADFSNAWLVGLFSAVFAVAAMRRERARFVNAALAAWLLASTAVLPHRSSTARWNDVIVGALMLGLALVPGTMYPRLHHRRATAHA